MEDLTGKKYGRWTVLGFVSKDAVKNKYYWKCRCDCGVVRNVLSSSLKYGKSVSCGCYNKEIITQNIKHGECKNNKNSKLYNVWHSMLQRCNNPNDNAFKYYGGRGITVCEEWKNSQSFIEWAYENGFKKPIRRRKKYE